MAWLELHQSAAWHSKTVALAQELGVRRNEALGALCTLWLWALEHAQNGHLGHLTDKEVAAAAGWHRRATTFRAALHNTGWLDDDGAIHDWHDFAGRLIAKRQGDLARKREDYEQRAGARKAARKFQRNGDGKSDGEFRYQQT